jgi:hypothetical protein
LKKNCTASSAVSAAHDSPFFARALVGLLYLNFGGGGDAGFAGLALVAFDASPPEGLEGNPAPRMLIPPKESAEDAGREIVVVTFVVVTFVVVTFVVVAAEPIFVDDGAGAAIFVGAGAAGLGFRVGFATAGCGGVGTASTRGRFAAAAVAAAAAAAAASRLTPTTGGAAAAFAAAAFFAAAASFAAFSAVIIFTHFAFNSIALSWT